MDLFGNHMLPRGLGASAASRAMKSNRSGTTCVAPSRYEAEGFSESLACRGPTHALQMCRDMYADS